MKQIKKSGVRHLISLYVVMTSFLFVSAAQSAVSLPPRFYHKTLVGTNFIPILGINVDGNVNPLDPTYLVDSDADIEADIVMAGYARNFSLFGRSSQLAYLQPMGDISIRSNAGAQNQFESSANGFGDPFFEFNINIIGPKPQRTLPDALRYNPGFSMDLLVDLSVPLGEYDKGEAVNMGTNRFWGRIGLPIIYQLGDVCAPGHRISLVLIPAVLLFGDNDDYGPNGNLTQSTDPGYSVAAHLTHDLNDDIWVSFDYTYIHLGDSEIGSVDTDGQHFESVGATIGTQITRTMLFSLGYQTTLDDNDSEDVQLSTFSMALTFFWGSFTDGLHRIGSDGE